jgi:hypothetical protein
MNKFALIISGIVFAIMLFELFPIGNTSMNKQTLAIGLIGVALTGAIMSYFLIAGIFDWLGQKAAQLSKTNDFEKSVSSSIEEYQIAKKEFKQQGDSDLLERYDYLKSNGIENMIRLALEEVLVERGLIETSPMHDKMEKIYAKIEGK